MKKYEILLILPGTLDENEAETKIQETVETLKGLTENVELASLGKNRLAYPVKHIRYGYFYIATFSAENEKVEELKNKLSLSRELLRAMISSSDKSADTKKISYFGEGRPSRQNEKVVTAEGNFKEAVKENISTEKEKVEEKVQEEKVSTEGTSEAKEEKVEEVKEVKEEKVEEKTEEAPVDLKEIDKKLDEILSDDSIISGV